MTLLEKTHETVGEARASVGVNADDLQAGYNDTDASTNKAGGFRSFPSTASKGSFYQYASDNAGDYEITSTNASFGQATDFVLPDPGNADGVHLVGAGTAPFTSGNMIKSSGTGGKMVDAGFAIIANTTGTYAGGGTSNAFTVTGLTASCIVTASILTSTNAVSIAKVVPSTDTLTVTFSADPGAGTTLNFIALTAHS